MSAHSWDEVEALLAEAVDLPAAERAALLDARCSGRPELRAEVESLLVSHDAAGHFLPSPTGGAIDGATPEIPSASGRTVGRFRLLDKIGEGGMGVVYRGERADGEFVERVAIKLVPVPFQSADALRRFRMERQILASLNHPDIVALIDGGLTDTGQAFLAMKFVEGVPITEYCEHYALPLQTRLQLFQRICAAVQYAHQNGIVHRDLKPGNILVTADGIPKVLDFGVAKLLDRTGHAVDATETTALRPFTPNYASPEQLRGSPVTTGSDVYALGVLLYEILAGSRPYDVAGTPLDEMLATVLEREPPRPSMAATRRRLPYEPRRLKGDLDAIVRKAMSKEASRRYASAQELSEDISRHLAGQPVLAREPSLYYFMSTLARRHRPAFVAAAVSVAALVAALTVSLWQTRVAVAERNRAAARFNEVRQLANSLIFKIHDQVQPLPGSTPVRQTIVSEALTYLENLSRDASGDAALQLELGKAYHRIGSIQGKPSEANLGDRQGAAASLRRAVALLAPIVSGPAAPREASLELGRAELSLSMIVNIVGGRDEAMAAARRAAAIAEAMVQRNPDDDDARRLLGSAHFQVALVGPEADAIEAWQRAGQVFETLLERRPDDADRQRNVALVHKYLGGTFASRNDLDQALAHYLRAKTLDEKRLAANPTNRQAQFDVGVDVEQMAAIHVRAGRPKDAMSDHEKSLAIFTALAESDPSDRLAQTWVLLVHTNLGAVHVDLRETERALQLANRAVALGQSIRSVDSQHQLYYIEALRLQGRARRQAGQAAGACDTFRQAAAILATMSAANFSGPTSTKFTEVTRLVKVDLAACDLGKEAR